MLKTLRFQIISIDFNKVFTSALLMSTIGLSLVHAENESETSNIQRGPGYANSSWVTSHGDSSNSDYSPVHTPTDQQFDWQLLQGSAPWVAPSVAKDGTLYISSGRGKGFSSLHAINPDGTIKWESAPYRGPADLDTLALFSCPVIDDAGDIYIGDANQLWAFTPNGTVKWQTDLKQQGINGVFVTAIIVGDYVGGASTDGKLALFHRSSGNLAMPVLDLPGLETNIDSELPPGLWSGGFIDKQRIQMVWDMLIGNVYEVTKSPAVHPNTGRIYVSAAGKQPDIGYLYGIDVVEDKLSISFQTEVPANSGTSPTISPDGKRVYAMANGELFALDANTGKYLWRVPVNGQAASPSVSPEDILYVLADDALYAIRGGNGEVVWQNTYHYYAEEQLPELPYRFNGLVDGKPLAFIDSIVTVSKNALWTSLMLGYRAEVFDRSFTTAKTTHLVALKPSDGSLIASYPLPDSSEGLISVGPQGQLYLNLLAVHSSSAYSAGYRWLLPDLAKGSKPQGGLVAFKPKLLSEKPEDPED